MSIRYGKLELKPVRGTLFSTCGCCACSLADVQLCSGLNLDLKLKTCMFTAHSAYLLRTPVPGWDKLLIRYHAAGKARVRLRIDVNIMRRSLRREVVCQRA